ncbi:MAG: histidine kinase dimerization/phosphoacceptor domain -containing protein, partial [Thermodesulfobacteriota bacterium]
SDEMPLEHGEDLLGMREAGWSKETHHAGKKTIEAYFPINSKIYTRTQPPGARKGISGEKWKLIRWYVSIHIDQTEAFAPINRIRDISLSIGGLAAIIVLILAVIFSRALTAPVDKLRRLTTNAKIIGSGGEWEEVKVSSHDEIGILTRAFNDMAKDLKKTTVSRDILAREVVIRTRAEEEVKKSLGEKEVLLKEIHHRVKNNLQIVSTLLDLQTHHIKLKKIDEIFNDCQSRISSIALIHEMLYKSVEINRIDFSKYLEELAGTLFNTYKASTGNIKFKKKVEDIIIDIDTAIGLGLISNELISNALKYAFPDGASGVLSMEFYKSSDGLVSFIIKDNGVGISEDIDIYNLDSLGLHLVNSLTRQLNGKLKVSRDGGTEFHITFPSVNYKVEK